MAGKADDRNVVRLRVRFDLSKNLKTVDIRHFNIQQDDFWQKSPGGFKAGDAGAGAVNLKSLAAQPGLEQAMNHR
jgi:hypothetical protein